MDIQSELNAMAQNAMDNYHNDVENIPESAVSRWQTLFGLTAEQASKSIKKHRADLNHPTVSNEHWNLVRDVKVTEGHDKESYEYAMTINATTHSNSQTTVAKPSNLRFLLKLSNPLDTPELVQAAAGLAALPKIHEGRDEDGNTVTFAILNEKALGRLVSKFNGQTFEPDIITLSMAEKDLCPTSIYPTLGVDSTLPHLRPQGTDLVYPKQDQYPVFYFFYGTLREPDRLMRLLDLSAPPVLHKAVGS